MKKQLTALLIFTAAIHTCSSLAMHKLTDAALKQLKLEILSQKGRIALEQAILSDKQRLLDGHQQYIEWQKRRQLSPLELLALSNAELEENVIEAERELTKADRKTAQKRRIWEALRQQLQEGREQLAEEEQEEA